MQNTYSIKTVLNLNNLEKLIICYGLTLGLSSLVSIKYSVVVPIGNFFKVYGIDQHFRTVKFFVCYNLQCLSGLFYANGREKTVNRLFTPRSAYTRDTQLFDVLYATIRSIPKPQRPFLPLTTLVDNFTSPLSVVKCTEK